MCIYIYIYIEETPCSFCNSMGNLSATCVLGSFILGVLLSDLIPHRQDLASSRIRKTTQVATEHDRLPPRNEMAAEWKRNDFYVATKSKKGDNVSVIGLIARFSTCPCVHRHINTIS